MVFYTFFNLIDKTWFDDNCEIGPSYRASKEEVVRSSKQCFKNFSDELKRLGFDYKKGIRHNGARGCWEGFRVWENIVQVFQLNSGIWSAPKKAAKVGRKKNRRTAHVKISCFRTKDTFAKARSGLVLMPVGEATDHLSAR